MKLPDWLEAHPTRPEYALHPDRVPCKATVTVLLESSAFPEAVVSERTIEGNLPEVVAALERAFPAEDAA